MKPKKIVFVNRFFYPDLSATSQILTDLAFDLANKGHEVHVIASRILYVGSLERLPASEIAGNVHIHRVWSTANGRSTLLGRTADYVSFFIGASLSLIKYADKNATVVVKTDPPLLSLVATPISRLRGARLVNWIQDLFPEVATNLGLGIKRGPLVKALTWCRNVCLRRATMNVAIGESMAKIIRAQDVRPNRVTVIPNWSDGSMVRPVPRDMNELRNFWGLQNSFVVGYSGNLGRAHDLMIIVEAADLLRSRSDIQFLIIGDGAQRQTLQEEVLNRRLDNFVFKPYQPREQLSVTLSSPDVHLVSLKPELEGLIVPSKFYGVTAAARPTIFIGAKDGEIALLLEEHRCGFTVSPGDAAALADAIMSLASVPELCLELGSNARSLFEERFDRHHATAKWEHLLVNETSAQRGQY